MIKTAICRLSGNLNLLEKRAGLFEKLRPVKTLGICLGYPGIEILQFDKGYFGQKVLQKHSFNNPFKDMSAPLPDEEAIFMEELNKFLSACDHDWDELILGIPRTMVAFKKISIPAPDVKMIPDILGFEIEKHIPFSPSLALYDYKILGNPDEKVRTLLVSVIKKDIVNFFIELLEKVGLTPTIIDISTCSIVNAVFFCLNGTGQAAPGSDYLVIVEKNENHVEIILLENGDITLSRSLVIPEEEKPDPDESIADFLVREIKKTTINYPFDEDGQRVPYLILSGLGFSAQQPLIETRLPGFKVLSLSGNSKPKDLLHERLSVSGLCVRGIPGNPFTLNLLPKSYKTGRWPSGIITLVLMITVLLMLPVYGLSEYYKNVKNLDTVNRLLDSSKKLSRATEELYVKTDRLKEEQKAFELLGSGSSRKLDIIKELTGILPEDVWVHSMILKKDKMEIVGYADRASPMINLLESSKLFSEVRFSGRIVKEKRKEKFRLTARFM